jgi:phage tail sheath gpL-like
MSLGLASILLVGISANFPNPGTFVQVNFAAGPTSGAPSGQTALIIGNKTSAGSATPDTAVYGPDTATPMQTESDVITIFGTGSQVHRAWRRFNRVNKTTPIYAIAAAESAGAQATGVVLVSGTATSAGNIRFFYGDEFVDTAVNVNDTATTIGGNVATNINNNSAWGITAVNTSGSVAITAKNHGPEGNWLKIQVLAGPGFAPGGVTVTDYGTSWLALTPYSTGVFIAPATANGFYYKVTTGGTSGAGAPAFPTTIGGTVTDSGGVVYTCWGTLSTQVQIASLGGGATADNYTNALATILPTGYYNIIVCDSDSTNIGKVVTQVNSQANPTPGIRQRVFAGTVDTSANANTLALALNAPRCELQWGYPTDISPLEIAANNAAIYSLFEQTGNTGYRFVGRLNFSLFPTANPLFNDSAYWFLVPSRNGPGYGPTVATVTSLLNNGVTPVQILGSGQLQLVKRITTHSTTTTGGSIQDWRIRDAHKVPIMDSWATAASNITQTQFAAKDLLDPPKQGQSPAAGQPPNVFATNVNLWGTALKDLTEKMGLAGLLQNTDVTNAAAIVQREASPRTRMSASFDLVTADIFDQGCIVANQVG